MPVMSDTSARTWQHDQFSSQPHEVLEAIFQNVTDRRDLISLCCVCKLFNRVAIPLLYSCLEIECPEGFNPRSSMLKRLSRSRPRIEYTSNIGYVRELVLFTKFQNLLDAGERCWHHRFNVAESDEESDCAGEHNSDERNDISDADDSLPEEHFLEFCRRLTDNTLRSFRYEEQPSIMPELTYYRWELGTCVPTSILGLHGYLPQHQTSLNSITLITDGACDMTMEGMNVYDLTKFVSLRRFCWTGPQSKEDFDAIKDCLAANAEHLESLTLNLMDWSKAEDFWYLDHTQFLDEPTQSKNFFAEDILGTDLDPNGARTGAFSIFRIRQLKLWNCPGMGQLLECLTEARQELSLVSLEVACGYQYYETDPMRTLESRVPPFLRKLSGLEELYLCLPVLQWDDIAKSVCTHLKTLERVVIHACTINIDDKSPYFEEEQDGDPKFCDGFYEPIVNGDCDVLGIQYPPAFVRECLEPCAKNVSCRLLHLRAAGDSLSRQDFDLFVDREEIDSFADWVFGPTGFSGLLVFAYGDFAFRDIHSKDNVLYCRTNLAPGRNDVGPVYYRVLDPTDVGLWEWVQSNMDTLSACAYKALLQV